MTAEDLLNILEQRQLVSSGALVSLRKQVAGAAKPIAPAAVIKLLVDKQQLTPGQAEQLLRSTASPALSAPKAPVAPVASKSAASVISRPATVAPSLAEELGLAPLESTPPAAAIKPSAPSVKLAPRPASAPSLADELGLAPLSDSSAQVAPAQKVVAAPAAKVVPVKPQSSPAISLEDELGLTTDSDGPANPTAGQQAAAHAKPNAATSKPAGAKDATTKDTVARQTAVKPPAKPAPAQRKMAVAAKSEAASDLGLDDDLYSDLGSGAGIFDEGLLSAAAETPGGALDMPADDPLSAAAAVATAVAPTAHQAARPKRWKRVLAIVGGALGFMLLAAGIAAAVLLRPTGDPEFAAAETDYKSEAWPAAVAKYNELLRAYPSQPHAGAARVHRALAQLRVELGERPQWPRVLETAERVLPQIVAEPEFAELQSDLSIILTDTADALTRSAAETDEPNEVERRVADARRALALATDARYVPPADRPWQRLQAIDDRLAVLTHEVDRPKQLAKAVAEIGKAATVPDPAVGFGLRDKLVERFPELAANDALQAALAELASAEKGLVKPSGEKSRLAVREQRKTAIKGWTAVIDRTMPATSGNSGSPALVALGGAVYAIDSASGKVLWRRYIGNAPAASAMLLPGDRAASGDALLVDERYHELLRVDAVSGQIKWRQALDKPVSGPPVVVGMVAYAATPGAALDRIDLKTGEVTKSITLPSSPVGSPAASSDGRYVYQLAARGELFALAAEDLSCAGVLYLGLEAGGLAYSPLVVARYVVVVDDYGRHESALRVVALDAQGLPTEVVSVVPISGRVAAAPAVVGNHLIVVNESGTIVALEITGNRDMPLRKTAEIEGGSPAAQWFLVEAGTQFWLAGAGWRGFELQKGRLTARGKPIAAEMFDASPSLVGKSIVGLYRRPGQHGAVAFANSLSGTRLWEVELGNPANTAEADDTADAIAGLHLSTIDQQGRETKLDLKQRSDWQTLESFAPGVRLANQKWLWWREPFGRGSIVFDPKRSPVRAVLPAEPAATPVALAGGLFMPTAGGALLLVDPSSGKSLATPFRPQVIGGETVRWSAPALSSNGTEVLIADDRPALYEVAVQKDPQPQLVKVAGIELDAPVVAGPVVAGAAAYLVTRDGMLRAYVLPGLKPAGEWKLPSRFVSWIRPAGDMVLLASGDELVGCSAAKKLLWKSPLASGTPCGIPLVTKDGIVVADANGRVVRFDPATGKELAKVELKEPLVAGPTLMPAGGGGATTADGCRLEFALP